jgi:hypothetical protein
MSPYPWIASPHPCTTALGVCWLRVPVTVGACTCILCSEARFDYFWQLCYRVLEHLSLQHYVVKG